MSVEKYDPDEVEVVEGELVEDDQPPAHPVRRVVDARPVRVVRNHEPTRRATKGLVRGALTTVQGLESWTKRAWDAGTMGVYRRQVKAAEAAGDREALAEWLDRKEHAIERRHKRLANLPSLVAGLAKVALGGLAVLVGLLVVLGVLIQLSGKGAFTDVITGVMNVVRWVFTAVAFAWTPLLVATPVVLVLAAWREGRRRGNQAPGWLATAGEPVGDVVIDERMIAEALKALRIPQITQYLKEGLPLQFLTPARIDGRGTHAVIRLPAGVTAEQIARRRDVLATGLYRQSKEVWPSTGPEAGILDLWVADKGALAEGAGSYPLLGEGAVDLFKGVPFGKTLRGEPVMAPIMERNTIAGGIPGQGKSSAARVLMAGAALDPRAELRIWIPDTNYDFEAFRPRCTRYVMGAEDEHIEQILVQLRELHDEVQRRGQLLIQHEVAAVTPEVAGKGVGMHPLVCLLEEAHVPIQHETYGKDIAKLLCAIVRLGRKRGIHVIVSTQAPTKDSMPRDVTRNCSNGIAFAVSDHVANDGLLGQGAYRSGHRATDLIVDTDKGTALCKGFSGERSQLVQAYFLDVDKRNDDVTPIIERSLLAMHNRGASPAEQADLRDERDLLDDVAEVLAGEDVNAAHAAARLKDLPHSPWHMSGSKLLARLRDEYSVPIRTRKGYPIIHAADVAAALAERQGDAPDDDENDV